MTQLKKLKKAIRARARKTGERYTAARRQVLLAREKHGASPARIAPTAPPPPVTPPKARATARWTRGLVGDAAILEKTGHGFDHWFAVLDRFDAAAQGHPAAVRHLHDAHGVPGWHAQGITVAYERSHGLRQTNQAGSGKFQVSVSKTVPASVEAVARAFGDARQRARWLRDADPSLARALRAALTGPKARAVKIPKDGYARLRYPWEGGTVQIHVYRKPNGASVVASNEGLPHASLVEQRRSQWRAALESLKLYLTR